MFFDILDEVERVAPDVRRLGREEKKLIDAKSILIDAQSRIANKNAVSFQDWGTGILSGGGAHLTGMSTPESIIMAAGALGLKRMGEQGRAAATIIKASRKLKEYSSDKKSIPLSAIGRK